MTQWAPPVSVRKRRLALSRWDALAVLLVLGVLAFLAQTSQGLLAPFASLQTAPLSLDPVELPGYAARTTLRMLAALGLSLLFTFTYATLAAKSRRAELLLLPLLDILQSVPILGFISVTVVFFMSLVPGRVLGAEFAAVFAIFTSQAWNMAFSFYQSLRTVPIELLEASRTFRFSPWMRFWRVEVPFAMPQLIWNMMMSMSGGWFFVVASEAISVGETTVTLPGVGSYIALAIERRGPRGGRLGDRHHAGGHPALRPAALSAARRLGGPFPVRAGGRGHRTEVLGLDVLRHSVIVAALARALSFLWRRSYRIGFPGGTGHPQAAAHQHKPAWGDRLWTGLVLAMAAAALWQIGRFVVVGLSPAEVGTAAVLGLVTMVRVLTLIALASLIWVPVGVGIGLRPQVALFAQPIAQFLAAFPANLLFPLVVSAIVTLRLDPDIWLSPLMILGTQWYILFNVIAGATAIPSELRDVGTNLRVGGWLWWRRVALPAIFPFYLTGAITASGGSWNASIIAEAVSWGDQRLQAYGLGAYIAQATEAGDFHRIVLGIAVMSLLAWSAGHRSRVSAATLLVCRTQVPPGMR